MSKRVLPNWIDGYLEYMTETEPSRLFIKWTAISAVASALQRKCYLNWGTLEFYPNMYIVLVGPSGSRKGTAMKPARKMLDDLGVRITAESTTRQSLIRSLREATNSCIDPATNMQCFHSSLTVHSAELTVFLGYDNKQLMSDLTDWYDCGPRWVYRTKTQGTDDIMGVWVNIIGATTPSLIQTTMPSEAIGGGLTSRMIFVYAPRKEKTVIFPYADPELYKTLVSDLEKISLLSGQFKVQEDFAELWSEWYPAQEYNPPFKHDKLSGYLERRPNHAIKLSMILSAARSDSMLITARDLRNSIKMLEEVETNMPIVFRGMGSSPLSDVMSRVMQYIMLNETTPLSELIRAFVYDADEFTLDRILKTLVKMKFCSVVQEAHGPVVRRLECEPQTSTQHGSKEE